MRKIKIGVIGTGHLGSIHTKLWKHNLDVDLVGIYDVDKDKGINIANEYFIKSFDSLDELFQNVDAVTIASPTTTHYEVAKLAIENNKHCFIEKPITSTYEEAVKLIELAEKSKVLIQVGHVERFNPAIKALKETRIEPMFIEAHRLSQFKPRATDVSVIHDLMIHDIDLMLLLVNSEIKTLDATGVSVITDTIDIANARIKFENGAVANLTASRLSAHPMRKMRIFQKNAYISIDFGNQEVEHFYLSENVSAENAEYAHLLGSIQDGLKNQNIYYSKPSVPKLNAIEEEQKAFINAIKYNEPIAVDAYSAAKALKYAEEISQQIENQK